MNRRTLLRAAIAAPVAAVVPLLLPKSKYIKPRPSVFLAKSIPKPTVFLTVLDVDMLTGEALIEFKHINGRVDRPFSERIDSREKEYKATGTKPIGWMVEGGSSTGGRTWRNEETGAVITQDMLDHLRRCLEPDLEKRNGFMWCTPRSTA